jgi:hypothetical protein
MSDKIVLTVGASLMSQIKQGVVTYEKIHIRKRND